MLEQLAVATAVLATQFAYSSFGAMPTDPIAQAQSSDYHIIEVSDFRQRNQISAGDPRAIAAQLLSRPESLEGRQEETIEITYPDNRDESAVVQYTVIGLADDSVRNQRTRIRLSQQASGWEITWVGEQYQCQPRRGHQDWSGEFCM